MITHQPFDESNQSTTQKTAASKLVLPTILMYILIFWILLPVFLFTTGHRLDMLLPVAFTESTVMITLEWTLIIAGSIIILISTGQLFFQGKGLPISHLPPTEFVAKGLYKYVRHPLYIGYTAAFAGTAILFHSFWSLAFSTSFLLLGWMSYALFYEEPILIKRFGDSYRVYKDMTALLFPKKIISILKSALSPPTSFCLRLINVLANQTVFFHRGRVIMVTYGIFITIGALIFAQLTTAFLLTQGVTEFQTEVFILGSAFSTIIFARFFWWLGHWREMIQQQLFGLRIIGFVSWGGIFGLVFFSCVFAFIYRFPLLMITDAMIRGVFASYSIGRLGCLTYGCCYGVHSHKNGIIYTNPHSKIIREHGFDYSPRYPTQVFSFLHGTAILITLNLIANESLPVGFLTAAAFILYSTGRAFIEFFRDRKRYYSIFTDGHIGSGIMFLIGWVLLFFISPQIDQYSPQPWSDRAFSESVSLVPIVLLIGGIIFFVSSFHWKKVGNW